MANVPKMVDNKGESEYYIDILRFRDTAHGVSPTRPTGQAEKMGAGTSYPAFHAAAKFAPRLRLHHELSRASVSLTPLKRIFSSSRFCLTLRRKVTKLKMALFAFLEALFEFREILNLSGSVAEGQTQRT